MIKKIFALLFVLAIHSVSFAQITNPCGGTDDDDVCPLDTWVYILVLVGMAFGAYKLYQKQKNLSL